MRAHGLFIGGTNVKSLSERLESVNPATGEVVSTAPDATAAEVDLAVAAARSALDNGWASSSHRDRSEVLRKMATLVRDRFDALVEIEVEETGRPVSEIRAVDIAETADCFDYYASAIRVARGQTIPLPDPYFDYTILDPVGVIAQLVPWNFPFNLASWKVAPALAMGNAIVLKPSELTPSTAFAMAEIAKDAGLPDGVLNIVTGRGTTTGHALVGHPDVDMVAFTGGVANGRVVAAQAAELGKKLALELGGKSAQIVFADADLDAAAASVLEGAFFAQGQNCCAGSRLLVEESIGSDFVDELSARAGRLTVGSPTDEGTQVGCMVSMPQFDRVRKYVEMARSDGARVFGGTVPGGDLEGRPFMSPTLVIDPLRESKLVQEEIFGPVLVTHRFDSEDDAIRLANGTRYDLAAGIWTNDLSRAHRVARRVRAGSVWINTYNRVFNDAPFGGMRWSGHGRDLGLEAMLQYTQIKNVCLSFEPGADRWY